MGDIAGKDLQKAIDYAIQIEELREENDRLRAQNEELVKALKGIVDSEASCHRCEGDGHLWADGKSHYATYKGPTVSCASCGGSGISYEDGIEIAQRALKSAESENKGDENEISID
jgi:hypothetical protein